MVADSTEEEQIETIKKWFEDNGTSLIVSMIIVLAVVFGYRAWETNTRETGEAASAIYEELSAAISVNPPAQLSEENIATSKFLADQLKQEYPNTTYAHFAAMHLAKIAVDDGDLATAGQELQWILDHSVDDKLAIIVNYRLAKVKLGQKDYDAAIAQIDLVEPGGHLSSYEELRGDTLYEMNRLDEAREAYQRAITAQGLQVKPITQMKHDDIVMPMAEVSAETSTEQSPAETDTTENATSDSPDPEKTDEEN